MFVDITPNMCLQAVARLPRCFGRDYGMHIEEFVMLCDPKNNEVEVQVEIKNNKVFFKNGWFGLKDFYNIDIGAWATLTYENPRLLRLSLKNRYDEEVDYPDCTPPIISRLDRGLCHGRKSSFCEAYVVELSAADIASGFLVHVCLVVWSYPIEKIASDIHIVCLFIFVGFALGEIFPEIVARRGNRDQSC